MTTASALEQAQGTKPPKKRISKMQKKEALWGLAFLSPWIIGFLVFYFLPMIASFYFSLLEFNPAVPDQAAFIGFDNWRRALFEDEEVRQSFFRTIHLPHLASIGLSFSLFLAICSIQTRFGKNVYAPCSTCHHDPGGRHRADLERGAQRTNRVDQHIHRKDHRYPGHWRGRPALACRPQPGLFCLHHVRPVGSGERYDHLPGRPAGRADRAV
jgi:hypothetical protein